MDLSEHAKTLNIGDEFILSATVTPADAADTGVTWSSDTPAVATVSPGGVVTAVAPGTAVITATSASAESDSCDITVTKPVTSAIELKVGKSELDAEGGLKITALNSSNTPLGDASERKQSSNIWRILWNMILGAGLGIGGIFACRWILKKRKPS